MRPSPHAVATPHALRNIQVPLYTERVPKKKQGLDFQIYFPYWNNINCMNNTICSMYLKRLEGVNDTSAVYHAVHSLTNVFCKLDQASHWIGSG